jgi:hypothetical protein
MSVRFKALLTLVAIAPILTEIVSGNTPAHTLLDPRIVLFLLMGYSLPLLIIRELSVRWRLSTAGVFLLGLAYGILNEGLIAQTLLRSEHVPIDKFDHYIYAAGFNFSWFCVIVPWHALLAVLFPITLVAFWFPSCSQTTWLATQAFAALSAVLIGLIVFLGVVRRPHPQMLACLFGMAVLVVFATLFRGRGTGQPSRKDRWVAAFLFGIAAYFAFFLGTIVLATVRVSALVFLANAPASLAALAIFSRRMEFLILPAAASVALGVYFAVAGFNALGGIAGHSLEKGGTGSVLAIVFLYLAYRGARIAEPASVC